MRTNDEVQAKLTLAQKQEKESLPFTVPLDEACYWIEACKWFLGDNSIKLLCEEEMTNGD